MFDKGNDLEIICFTDVIRETVYMHLMLNHPRKELKLMVKDFTSTRGPSILIPKRKNKSRLSSNKLSLTDDTRFHDVTYNPYLRHH